MKKLLSIVIANYNYGRFLEDAIKSVLSQDVGDQVELIVCDGGSTDNSLEVIRKYAERIAWWCSEKDDGQSDAFNKGFFRAKGKYLTWLNADDLLVPGCLEKICRELAAHPECEWFTGNLFRFTDSGRVIDCPWGPHYLPICLQTRHQPVAVYGPTTIFAKALFDRAGGMKVYQHFMMDTDLWMRFIVAGVKQRRINCFCWAFRMHEGSKTAEYGNHKLSSERELQFQAEAVRSLEETGYKISKLNHRLIQIWRLVDGSAIVGLWKKLTFDKYYP